MNQPPLSDMPHTILIVSAAEFPALEQALARAGFRVSVVNRGDTALAAIARDGAAAPDRVALVLLDAALAGSAKMELCAPLADAAPVLVMSAAPSDEEREHALRAGAAGYLRLPCAPGDVVEKVTVELTARHAWLPAHDAGPLDTGTLEVNYHALLAGSPDAIILFDAAAGLPVDVNRNAERMFGRGGDELMHMHLTDLCPPRQPDGTPSEQLVETLVARGLSGDIRIFPLTFQHSSGRHIDGEIRLVVLEKNGMRLLHMRVADVTGLRIAEALRMGQNRLLEMIARGAPLGDILDKLLRLVEGQAPGLVCTVLLLDDDGATIRGGAAPSLPPEFIAAHEGLRIGPEVGSCGRAMACREAVVVADIRTDPLWQDYRELAERHGLRACWAMPIMTDRHTVLGSFAMYYRDVRLPRADDERLIGVAAHLAGIAIERTRREAELARHRHHLEELVAARTAELRAAKERAEGASVELAAALEDLRKTQDELVRRDKLAALGSLVAGVAHELNTPIGNSLTIASAMSEHLATLRQRFDAGLRRSDLEHYLEHAAEADDVVVRNLRRAAALITSFRQVAVDTASSQRRQFRLDEFIAELVLPLSAGTPPPRPRVVQDVVPGLVMDSYPGPLGQAISALFENAVLHGLAGRDDGVITLAARAGRDGTIELTVADNGAGIAPEHLERVYDPFFTTRPGAGGSGLGLHVTHNIVTGVLKGRIALDSRPGAGTTFTLTLPAITPTTTTASAPR
ncbi:PAS domain S-box-containing protein [Pseudoduganella flava]|uniref:histidine kinase n=1 Tax=Pseudoduganella flava TaxID=871742 RepID=A0A562PK31_9BURK|nr:ATP-binding protein [Pseudoduganella flava]QGZ42289.1 GAF domain-containing protein [Pseudoduganella flava]TWI44835.1 PAS domain S-box-containing protein [Pseudoduganella flava]